MNGLTYLNIEISDECPLTDAHPECPRSADRFRGVPQGEPITVDDAARFYRFCVQRGFRGMLAPQYYNEPLATRRRLMQLMIQLPEARFSLRTNGVLLDDSPECRWLIEHSEEVWVTVYPETNRGMLDKITARHGNVYTIPHRFDNRIAEDVPTAYNPRQAACIRPRFELDVDYYGNGRLCCGDWRGEIAFGNIKTDSHDAFLRAWYAARDPLAALLNPITPESYERLPHICKLCLARTPELGGPLQ